jgi:hypothetical protein
MLFTQTGYLYNRNGFTFIAFQAFVPSGSVAINSWVYV